MTLTWQPLRPDDVPALTDLVNAAIEADGTGRPISASSIAEHFDSPRFNPETDSIAVWDGTTLVASGSTWTSAEPVDGHALARFDGDVHPEHRGRGIGRQLLSWVEARSAELLEERLHGLPQRVRTSGGTPGSATQRLLELAGYRPDNYFVTMEVDLARWRDPGEPAVAVPMDANAQLATRDAHNDAFRDHRASSAIPEAEWAHWMGTAASRHDIGRVVRDENDRVLAYALVSEQQPGVAHIELLGTRREARGRGFARGVLLETLRAAHEAGYAVVELEVDSTSPTGADRLYTNAGFTPVRTISRYQRDLT